MSEAVMSPETTTEVLTITPKAIHQIKKLQESNSSDSLPLRVFVQAGGCKGMSYGLMFDDQPLEEGDVTMEKEGVNIVVDGESIRYLQGAVIDFEENLIGGGFKIQNPNAVKSCGCGSSFKACG
ncbi:MAG: iron-sulfur cluster insertion protein ErpA [bacterium]|nr:iron-sulfur cluster insertion protein ErpA [bacterium]